MSALPLNASLKGKNRFCGPAALAAVMNCSTDEAARLIRKQSGQHAVKGTSPSAVFRAITANGGSISRGAVQSDVPLWQVVKGQPLTIVEVLCEPGDHFSGHFVVVRRGKVIDSFTRKWVPIAEHPWRNAKVQTGTRITSTPSLPAKPKRKTAAQRRLETQIDWLRTTKWMVKALDQELANGRYQSAAERLERFIRGGNAVFMSAAERRAIKAARAERQRKIVEASLLTVKAGEKSIDELYLSETGRWDDAGSPDEGQVVSAINRSPAGMICFNSVEEIEDAIWSIETGTAFYDEPHKKHHLEALAGTLDRWLRQNNRKVANHN